MVLDIGEGAAMVLGIGEGAGVMNSSSSRSVLAPRDERDLLRPEGTGVAERMAERME